MKRETNHFYNWSCDKNTSERKLFINGDIAADDGIWFGNECTPEQFKSELEAGSGDITVWLNSAGGDVFSASQIYNMLRGYDGKVTVKVDGLAASAASVIAMAGDEILMSPLALMMIHNPLTVAIGDSEEMKKAVAMLDEVKESIINAYEAKTGLSRKKISNLMDEESWMNAEKAVKLGFADGILFKEKDKETNPEENFFENYKKVVSSLVSWKNQEKPKIELQDERPKEIQEKSKNNITAESLFKRLNLLKY